MISSIFLSALLSIAIIMLLPSLTCMPSMNIHLRYLVDSSLFCWTLGHYSHDQKATVLPAIPSDRCCNDPVVIIEGTTLAIVFDGIAKPMPANWPVVE